MLESLYETNWSELHHAYGTAHDIPGLIEKLAKKHERAPHDDIDEALRELYGSICHQGLTVYEATPYVVPFLFEIVMDKAAVARVEILIFLGAIASAHDGYPDASHLASSRLAVMKHLDSLYILMREENSPIAISAAHAVVSFTEESERMQQELLRMLEQESTELFRAGMLYLLGRLAKLSEPAISQLLSYGACANPLERQAARLAIAMQNLPNLPGFTRDWIIEIIASSDAVGNLIGLPWAIETEIGSFNFLEQLNQDSREKCLALFMGNIKNGKGNHGQVSALMDIAFERQAVSLEKGSKQSNLLTADELSKQQRAVLEVFLEAYDVPDSKRIFYGLPGRWRLPNRAKDIRALLQPKRSWWGG